MAFAHPSIFVPNGQYVVPEELRKAIDQAGCELGVHGLEHDGKLYNSKRKFGAKAARINEFLRRLESFWLSFSPDAAQIRMAT